MYRIIERGIVQAATWAGLVGGPLLGAVTACSDSPAGLDAQDAPGIQASTHSNGLIASETAPLQTLTFAAPAELVGDNEGTAVLKVHSNHSFNLSVDARNLDPGHAITLWAFDGAAAGGRVASGIVGGNGEITLAGNNCIDAAVFASGDIGKDPGTPQSCDLIDLSVGPPLFADWVSGLNVFLVDHGLWEPGDLEARWTTDGFIQTHGAFLFDLTDLF